MLASSAISHLTFTFRPEITLYRRLKSLKSIAFPHFQASSSVFSASKRHGILIGPSIMTEVISPSFSGSSRGHEGISAFEQEHLIDESSELRSAFTCDQLESTLNRLSKWLVTGLLGVVILWRHDAEALWAAMGSVINSGLSVILKRILNQERPVSTLRSDPGMPSSHAQSIFFSALFASMSVVEWLGMNALSLTLSALVLIFGSYLSWLRVSQQLHTISQVVVGAVVGSIFCVLWFWSWSAIVLEAFISSLWVRTFIVLTAAGSCVGFLLYVIRYWLKDDS